ncbi:fatty acid desaturase-domain-containing protein [Piptocephalis cylindrospora]|uniref:Fatty acid desaturase-domain-containing protein n=1 Tax=Piptocephalis cylindrospora TaxID=1907219 RepID=A0A4P9Y2C2_9FUNG|nr:fatty acid desaturase-domain-containing protein [Piptocephalis cylindrospora]|eukprot:RKP12913.1 fatty acid desaturase-domain-containing protein [Piptocephalis cylindrospora]
MAPPEAITLSKSQRKYTAADVREMVERGRKVLMFRGQVLDVTRWLPYHPGGEEALLHGIGRDMTDEIISIHPREVFQTQMARFAIGEYISSELEHQDLSESYRALYAKIDRLGYLDMPYTGYTSDLIRIPILFITAISLLIMAPNSIFAQIVSASCMGMGWQQASFVAHDLGHSSVSLNRRRDQIIGISFGNFIGGVSLGWWKHNHNVHHIITNHPYDDPDIHHMPFFAVSTHLLGGFYSSYYQRYFAWSPIASFFISLQHYLYYLVLSLARFNLYVRSWAHLLFRSTDPLRYFELLGLATFIAWYSLLLAYTLPSRTAILGYVLLSHAVAGIIHVQITMSHFGMSTDLLGPHESYPAKILRTTMDFDCPPYMDWFHGGLQYQVAHHFFPRAPRHCLRELTGLVKTWAEGHNLTYTHFGWVEGNGFVLGQMRSIANQVRFVMRIGKEQWDYQPPTQNPINHPHDALSKMGLERQ